MHTTYEDYQKHIQQVNDLHAAAAVLSWDKEVNLPPKGAAFRSRQVATLSGLAHEQFTDTQFGENIKNLLQSNGALTEGQRRNLERTQEDYQKATCLDRAFVVRRSEAVSRGYHDWLKARKENDFTVFQDALAELVEIKKEEAEHLGYDEHPYDALLDQFEPGYKSSQLDTLFADVREQLVDFVRRIREQEQVDDQFLYQTYDTDTQWDFSLYLLKNLGYDFEAGRQDLSPHPFTITFSPQDVRVTTHGDPHNFASMCWSSIHEGGHALYEQGLPPEQYGMPLGQACSLGIHESQSRLWENQVGRSLPFWKAHYPELQKRFPEQLGEVSLKTFYRGINKIAPSPIRIESDELHYHFHILIRYEIEKGLIEGNIAVKDLPDIWKEKYKAYLGLDIPDDNTGVLQDIHWAHGSLGYFPTYSLGSFYAAQFYVQAQKDIPGLDEQIAQGDNTQLLTWLRKNIHAHGRYYTADELCRKVTGESLNFAYFMDYAAAKYEGIYQL